MFRKFLLFSVLLVIVIPMANARGAIIYSNGVTVDKVMDLPQRDEFTIGDDYGNWYHADLGIMHDQFSLFWIPLYNYGENQYVLYRKDNNEYLYAPLSKNDIRELRKEFSGIPLTPQLPFWSKWGGKLLALGNIILVLVSELGKDDEVHVAVQEDGQEDGQA